MRHLRAVSQCNGEFLVDLPDLFSQGGLGIRVGARYTLMESQTLTQPDGQACASVSKLQSAFAERSCRTYPETPKRHLRSYCSK